MKKCRKKIVAALAVLTLSALIVCAIRSGQGSADRQETVFYKEEIVSCGDLVQGITERGSVAFEISTQRYDVAIDDTQGEEDDEEEEDRYLKIEEVYVRQGQRIREGEPLYKVTEGSIRSVRRYLTARAQEAGILLEERQNAYETESVKAQGELQKSLHDQNWAEMTYAVETAQAETEAALAADSLAVLEEDIRQLEAELEDCYEDYADLQEEYETYKRRYEEWDPDNLYTYIPLRTQYLDLKQRYEEETEKRQDKRSEIEEKQAEIEEIQAKIARMSAGAQQDEMEARQRYETATLEGSLAQEVYAYSLQSLVQGVETAQEEWQEWQKRLQEFDAFVGEDGVIRAQGSGLVTEVYYETGDILREEGVLLTWVEDGGCMLTVDVAEEDISSIEIGDDVIVVLTAYPEETYEGTVREIDSMEPSQNTATVSYLVTIKIDGDTSRLYEGMTGDVTFIADQVTQAVYVSRRAVKEEGGKYLVTVRGADGEMTEKEVKTGFTDGTHIQILDGLSAGDIIYIETTVRTKAGADVPKEQNIEKTEVKPEQRAGRDRNDRAEIEDQ